MNMSEMNRNRAGKKVTLCLSIYTTIQAT